MPVMQTLQPSTLTSNMTPMINCISHPCTSQSRSQFSRAALDGHVPCIGLRVIDGVATEKPHAPHSPTQQGGIAPVVDELRPRPSLPRG